MSIIKKSQEVQTFSSIFLHHTFYVALCCRGAQVRCVRELGPLCYVSSNSHFYILNNIIHIFIYFFIHTYLKKITKITFQTTIPNTPYFFEKKKMVCVKTQDSGLYQELVFVWCGSENDGRSPVWWFKEMISEIYSII